MEPPVTVAIRRLVLEIVRIDRENVSPRMPVNSMVRSPICVPDILADEPVAVVAECSILQGNTMAAGNFIGLGSRDGIVGGNCGLCHFKPCEFFFRDEEHLFPGADGVESVELLLWVFRDEFR